MNGRPPQSYRAGRSGAYSKEKFTNWTDFDPYHEEISALPASLQPHRVLPLGGGGECRIYERPLSPGFLRPYTGEDVARVLASLPQPFLRELKGVFLMGGTGKQARIAWSDLYRYGSYGSATVHLFAFPCRRLERRRKGPCRPHVVQEYLRAGATCATEGNEWVCRFTEESLRLFYLADVLIHEVGHHVDRLHLFRKPAREGEAFAHWFVREHGESVRRLLCGAGRARSHTVPAEEHAGCTSRR
jgi:hypothetical protein